MKFNFCAEDNVMIIRTETYRDLEEDIATICDCAEEFIYEKISDFNRQCIDGFNSNWDKFYDLIDKFVDENADLNLIDEVYVYHLARHYSEPTELLPLKELLITQNTFSAFLADNDIVFKEQDEQLAFYYKRCLITAEQLLLSGHHHLLAKRLGYLGEADFCINGFAFWPDIEETSDGYYRDLSVEPEFIRCIGEYINVELWREYRKRTNYYGVVFKVPINEIIFDGMNGIETKEDKARYLVKKSLFTLHGCYFNYPSSTNNPIIRIKDDAKAKVDHCILINE